MQQHTIERLLQNSSLSFWLQKLTKKEHVILQKQKEYFSLQDKFSSFFVLSPVLLFDVPDIFFAELSLLFSFILFSLLQLLELFGSILFCKVGSSIFISVWVFSFWARCFFVLPYIYLFLKKYLLFINFKLLIFITN